MNTTRKITVSMTVMFCDMQHKSTDAALAAIKQTLEKTSKHCEDEIRQALESVGAREVTVQLIAY